MRTRKVAQYSAQLLQHDLAPQSVRQMVVTRRSGDNGSILGSIFAKMEGQQEPDQRPPRAAMGPVLEYLELLDWCPSEGHMDRHGARRGDIEHLLEDFCGKIAGKYSAMSSRP